MKCSGRREHLAKVGGNFLENLETIEEAKEVQKSALCGVGHILQSPAFC